MNNVTLGPIPNVYTPITPSAEIGNQSAGENFSSILSNAVNSVDRLHDEAAAQVSNLMQGGGSTDLNDVMVAVEKADVSFQLMMQVRNKIVNAYQEIEKMQF